MATSPKARKSYEFCTIDDDGEPSDLALHAGILDDEEITARADAKEAAQTPGPALNEKDERDLSDLDELDELIDTSDVPEADEEWFRNAKLKKPDSD